MTYWRQSMKIKNRSKQRLHRNVRWYTLIAIDQVEHHQQYSNVVIDNILAKAPLDERDRRLMTTIVYGVIQRRYTLDYYLEPFIQGKSVDPWVLSLLRLSVYQLIYMDRIPQHAVVNEAVRIAKINGHEGLGRFVNGVLRNFLRESLRDVDAIESRIDRLSVRYSIEPWIIEYLDSHLQESELIMLLDSLLTIPHLSARINPRLTTREELIQQLLDEGIQAEMSDLSPYGLIIKNGDIFTSNAFKNGYLTIQDESSMLVAPIGQIQGDEQVLDACSAPGGKATHIASLLETGHLMALDISANKMERVVEHMHRMGLSDTFSYKVIDALKFIPSEGMLYDIIYLDVPCSGLGLMRRKPEIKYVKNYHDIQSLSEIQSQLIHHYADYVKPGGYIVYSTCTLSYEENEDIIHQFLLDRPDFAIEPITQSDNMNQDLVNETGYIRIWPHQFGSDGFFICRLTKKDK